MVVKRQKLEKLQLESASRIKRIADLEAELSSMVGSAKDIAAKVFSSKKANVEVFGISKNVLKMRKALGDKDEAFLRDPESYTNLAELSVEGEWNLII